MFFGSLTLQPSICLKAVDLPRFMYNALDLAGRNRCDIRLQFCSCAYNEARRGCMLVSTDHVVRVHIIVNLMNFFSKLRSVWRHRSPDRVCCQTLQFKSAMMSSSNNFWNLAKGRRCSAESWNAWLHWNEQRCQHSLKNGKKRDKILAGRPILFHKNNWTFFC